MNNLFIGAFLDLLTKTQAMSILKSAECGLKMCVHACFIFGEGAGFPFP